MNAEEAYHIVRRYISKHDSRFPNWYCGITADVERRLFIAHDVSKTDHLLSMQNARRARKRVMLKTGYGLMDVGAVAGAASMMRSLFMPIKF